LEGAGNLVIQDIVHRLSTPVHHLVFESFYRGERLRAAVQDHREIVEAVMAGDAAAAELAMRTHVINGLRYLSELDRNFHYGDG
jgi:DNA-binding GntR family transcriptional regulator